VITKYKGICKKDFIIDKRHWECPVYTNNIGHCDHWVCEGCQDIFSKDKVYQFIAYK